MEKYLICKKHFQLPWDNTYKFEQGKTYKYIENYWNFGTDPVSIYVYYDEYCEKGHTFYFFQQNLISEHFYIGQELRKLKLEKLNENTI